MKRLLINIILVILCFALQCTVFYPLSIDGIIPNVLIVLTAACGFMQGERTGILIGFFCGLLLDIFFIDTMGLYALLYMYMGYLNGLFHNIFYPNDIKLPLILIIGSDLICSGLIYVLTFMLRSKFNFGFYFVNIILPEVLYTILVTVILYPLLLLLDYFMRKTDARSDD